MKKALLEMDGTIINSSGPTFGDYMTKRYKSEGCLILRAALTSKVGQKQYRCV